MTATTPSFGSLSWVQEAAFALSGHQQRIKFFDVMLKVKYTDDLDRKTFAMRDGKAIEFRNIKAVKNWCRNHSAFSTNNKFTLVANETEAEISL